MRTFLAVPLPPASAEALYRARSPLRETWSGFRWIKPENYHITLVFIGNRPEKTIRALQTAIVPAVNAFPDFEIGLGGVGCFGPLRLPRILLERIDTGYNELLELQSAIRPAIEALIGWERRSYRPHVSLGRPRRGASSRAGQVFPNGRDGETIKPFRAREVILYHSETKADGAVYSPIEKWKLEGKA